MNFEKTARCERVIQFGEGGFLRGFVDWMLQKVNEKSDFNGSVVVVQPIEQGMCDMLTQQNGLYTNIIRGVEGVETKVIDVISRCVNPYRDFEEYLSLADNEAMDIIISNTTESGIVYNFCEYTPDKTPTSFPAKLTLLLHRRFKNSLGGFLILPCELIEKNGEKLKEIVLKHAEDWKLGDEFTAWINNENTFCNTLVDRINTGYPKDEKIDLEDVKNNLPKTAMPTRAEIQAHFCIQVYISLFHKNPHTFVFLLGTLSTGHLTFSAPWRTIVPES